MILLYGAVTVFASVLLAALIAQVLKFGSRADELDPEEIKRLTQPRGNVTVRRVPR